LIGSVLALALFIYTFALERRVAPGAVAVSVSIDMRHPGTPVPREFLGLSFEVYSLHQIAQYGRRGDLVRMLRSLGPGVIRFGGVTADTQVAWTDDVTPKPAWATSALKASDFRGLRRLASESGWHILLTIGLAHYDSRAAAREAAAAKKALGGWLAGIELGNEPDSYARHGFRSSPWTLAEYNAQVASYRRAIAKVAPGIPLVGPDVSGSDAFLKWGRSTAIQQRPALLTGHHYPLGCHNTPKPTIARLLSPAIRRAEEVSLGRYVTVARAAGIPFRLDEAGSVSCGGAGGISNTFASALWALDYIVHTMAAGAVGINLEGNPANCRGYTPVCAPTRRRLADGALRAQPEWYALLLSKALIGDRPVRAIFSASCTNVDVLAMLGARRQLQVVIVDDDPPAAKRAAITLRVGRRFTLASTLSLTAPSPAATTGIRLGGRTVGSDGTLHSPVRSYSPVRAGAFTLELPPSSAALVTLAPRIASLTVLP
jgi:hypothetical protein